VETAECGIRYDPSHQNLLAYYIFSLHALTLLQKLVLCLLSFRATEDRKP